MLGAGLLSLLIIGIYKYIFIDTQHKELFKNAFQSIHLFFEKKYKTTILLWFSFQKLLFSPPKMCLKIFFLNENKYIFNQDF